MKAPAHIALALVFASGGLLVGRSLSSARHPSDPPPATFGIRDPWERRATSSTPARLNLKKARDLRAASLADPLGLRREMERLGVTGLRELILAMAGSAGDDYPLSPDSRAGQAIAKAALEELHRREGTAAIEWTSGIGEAEGRQIAMRAIIAEAARSDAATAKPWIDRFEIDYGKLPGSDFILAAVAGAKSRGAEDLLKLRGIFGSRLDHASLLSGDYGPDFDFFKYISTQAEADGEVDMDALRHWSARDSDAAWRALRHDPKAAEFSISSFTSIMKGAIAGMGEAAAIS